MCARLQRYQQLVDGKSETDAQVLDRLIDQWVVRNEADTAQFPHPTPTRIDKGVERVQKSFTPPEEYETAEERSRTDRQRRAQDGRVANVSEQLSRFAIPPFGASGIERYPGVLRKSGGSARAGARPGAPSLDAARDVDSRSADPARHRRAGRPLAQRKPLAHRRGKNAWKPEARNEACEGRHPIWTWVIHTPWVLAVLCILAVDRIFRQRRRQSADSSI